MRKYTPKDMKTMKACLYLGRRRLSVREVPRPARSEGQVLVRVHAGSVCGTDLRIVAGDTAVKPGIILGHDFCGTVLESDPSARGVRRGDRVAVSPVGHCGKCHYCAEGTDTLCERGSWHGFERDGGLAEYVVVDSSNLIRLPRTANLDKFAMLEPFVVALRCFDRTKPRRGTWLCVFGQGAVGLAATVVARCLGLRVLTVEPVKENRVRSVRLGAARCYRRFSPAAARQIRRMTGGRGVDIALDASGSQEAVDWSREVVKPDGAVLLAGGATNLRGPLLNTGGKELSYVEIELGPMRLYRRAVMMILRGAFDPFVLDPVRARLTTLPQLVRDELKKGAGHRRILVYPDSSFPSN